MSSPWFRFFLEYDPLPVLQTLKTPALVLYGQKDVQVSPKFNEAPMKQALKSSSNSDYEVQTLPDLNHLFQHAYSGAPAEYEAIEETFSPEALQQISNWIAPRAGLHPPN